MKQLTKEQMEARKELLRKIYQDQQREKEAMNLTHRNENMKIIEEALELKVLFNTPTSVEHNDE